MKKAGDIGATNTQYHPPVCHELACSRLASVYHIRLPLSNSCMVRMELDIAYDLITRSSYVAVSSQHTISYCLAPCCRASSCSVPSVKARDEQ